MARGGDPLSAKKDSIMGKNPNREEKNSMRIRNSIRGNMNPIRGAEEFDLRKIRAG